MAPDRCCNSYISLEIYPCAAPTGLTEGINQVCYICTVTPTTPRCSLAHALIIREIDTEVYFVPSCATYTVHCIYSRHTHWPLNFPFSLHPQHYFLLTYCIHNSLECKHLPELIQRYLMYLLWCLSSYDTSVKSSVAKQKRSKTAESDSKGMTLLTQFSNSDCVTRCTTSAAIEKLKGLSRMLRPGNGSPVRQAALPRLAPSTRPLRLWEGYMIPIPLLLSNEKQYDGC